MCDCVNSYDIHHQKLYDLCRNFYFLSRHSHSKNITHHLSLLFLLLCDWRLCLILGLWFFFSLIQWKIILSSLDKCLHAKSVVFISNFTSTSVCLVISVPHCESRLLVRFFTFHVFIVTSSISHGIVVITILYEIYLWLFDLTIVNIVLYKTRTYIVSTMKLIFSILFQQISSSSDSEGLKFMNQLPGAGRL